MFGIELRTCMENTLKDVCKLTFFKNGKNYKIHNKIELLIIIFYILLLIIIIYYKI